MLGKLIKHEFRATGRIMLPVLAALLALSIAAGLSVKGLENVSDGSFVRTLYGLMLVLFFVSLVAVCVVVLVLMLQRFSRSLLGDEGYLFFTLPVSPDAIIWSRLIVSSVWFVVTALLCFAAMLIVGLVSMDLNSELLAEISAGFRELRDALSESLFYLGNGSTAAGRAHVIGYAFELIVAVFLGSCVGCLQFYAPISIGYSFSNHKKLLSVVFFFVFGIAAQILSTAFLFSGGLNRIGDLIASRVGSGMLGVAQAIHYALLFIALETFIVGVIYYAITSIFLRRKLNLP